MPKTINYGTKTLRKEQRNVGVKPMFVLVKDNNTLENKCFCSACQNLFDWTPPEGKTITKGSYRATSQLSDIAPTVSCPDCGEASSVGAVFAETEDTKIGHIKLKGSYKIPDVLTGRFLFAYEDENGNTTRVDDNLMVHSTIVYPSGRTFQYDTEYSLTNDLIKNAELMTKTRIIGEKREELSVKDTVDTFAYMPVNKSFSPMTAYNINRMHAVGIDDRAYSILFNPIAQGDLFKQGRSRSDMTFVTCDDSFERMIRMVDEPTSQRHFSSDYFSLFSHDDACVNLDNEILSEKTKLIGSRYNVDPVYVDFFNNGLFLKEHHPGSTEADVSNISRDKRLLYTYLMTKYPVAFEYACERADLRCTNWTFEEQRRAAAKADEGYVAKELPNSVKAKVFREEVQLIAEQLAAVDDKILNTIRTSKDVTDMKQKLQFFVFGQSDKMPDTQVPKDIRLDGDKTKQNPIDATKKLKSAFNANMIGVANTVYTCHKLGIKDINYVNTVIAIANESPDLQPTRRRRNGQYFYQEAKKEPHRHALTITPVRDTTMLRFLKNYANTHSQTDLIESVYGSADKWDRMTENVRIYADILKHADIANSHEDIEQNIWNLEKARLKDYLRHKSIQEAYVDYVGMYGDKTPKKVNMLAYQIKQDNLLLKMKKTFDASGLDGVKADPKFSDALAKFPPYCDSTPVTKAAAAEDPDKYATEFFTKYRPVKAKETVVPQNGKSLFNNRSMDELHDELSHMSKNCKYPNTELQYSERDKSLEAEYEAPDGSGTWSFSLHHDTNEMIRTATELSNCLASHQDYAVSGRHKYLYMTNELGEKVACISLYPRGNSYTVGEFQAAHDNAVDGRYKDVIMQWLNEHEIDYRGNSNVEAIGTDRSFYGGRDADYHHEEVDEVTGAVISIAENEARAKRRHEQAIEVYGLKDDGSLNLPDVPEELHELN